MCHRHPVNLDCVDGLARLPLQGLVVLVLSTTPDLAVMVRPNQNKLSSTWFDHDLEG